MREINTGFPLVATKAIDDKEQRLNKPDANKKARRKLFLIRAAFLIAWLSFSSIIFVIALLSDINWTRPGLEQVISQSLRRNVKLGRLSWEFDWHGLSIDTSSLLVADRTGNPFLMTRRCKIGFSMGPLLLGKQQIQYVSMENPLFMAVHTGEKKWNFDDLLVASPDIDFIQIKDGHIFVVDRQPSNKKRSFPDTELNNLQIKLQRAGSFTPAQANISFALAGQKTKATYNFDGKTWGQDSKPWWDKKSHFELSTKRFTAENWQTIASVFAVDNNDLSSANPIYRLMSAIPLSLLKAAGPTEIFLPTLGQFDLHVIADGLPDNKLKADVQLQVDNLIISARNKTKINLPETYFTGHIELKQNSISWNKVVVKIPAYQLQLNSVGNTLAINDSNQENYQWYIIGLLGNLDKLNPLAECFYNNILSGTKNSTNKSFVPLDGKLFFDLHLNRSKEKTEYGIALKAADINIEGTKSLLLGVNRLINNKTVFDNPFEKKCLEQLNLSKQAEFTGTIAAKSGQGLSMKDCYLKDNQMSWKISGQANEDGSWDELTVSNSDLQLNKLSDKLASDPLWAKQVKAFLGLRPNCRLELNGKAQIEFSMKPKNNVSSNENELENFACATTFNDVGIKISEPRLDITHLTGSYVAGQNILTSKDIHFTIAGSLNSAVDINAQLPGNALDPLHFYLHAKNINVADLFEILKLFHLDTKYLDCWHLSGNLADVELSIKGTPKSPVITLTALPNDLVFALPNLKQLIHANGGKILYANDVFSTEKVKFTSQNSTCIANLAMRSDAFSSKLEKLDLHIEKADLNDLQNISMAFPSASNYFANTYTSLGKKYQITNLKGVVSGTIEYDCQKNKPRLSSLLDFDNISFKAGLQKMFFHGIKGNATLTDNDLALHDITGNVDDTFFTLHGRLNNYKDKFAQWQGEFSAQLTPDQLTNILSLSSSPNQKFPLILQGKKAIFVKLKSSMQNNLLSQSFTLSADPDAALSIGFGDFNFYQPAKKLIINGSCNVDQQKLTWRNLNFDFGGCSLSVQGSISNYKENSKLDPVYDLQIQTSDYMPANTIGQMISYGVLNGALTGQIRANLSVQGPTRSLFVSGKILLLDVSIPDLYLNHIVGTLVLQPTKQTPGSAPIPLFLQLDKLSLADLQLSQASGNLSWQPDESLSKQSQVDSAIYLKNFVARIANGQFTADGHISFKTKKASLNLDITEANLAQLWPQITSYQIKASGLLNSHLSIETAGSTFSEFEQNIVGSGKIHIGHGSFSRLAQFNARLNQVNLLHQGMFGFNINNLMQSVLPAKSSEFNSIDSAFNRDKEIITVRHVLYDGKDIKFSAAGKVNLALRNLDVDIAGVMPRVSNSVLGGKLGELSREITLQKLLDGVTMHKLEKLPSLPLIGGIAGGPDIFSCRIQAPYDQPKLISQSIQKSFRWLHNR